MFAYALAFLFYLSAPSVILLPAPNKSLEYSSFILQNYQVAILNSSKPYLFIIHPHSPRACLSSNTSHDKKKDWLLKVNDEYLDFRKSLESKHFLIGFKMAVVKDVGRFFHVHLVYILGSSSQAVCLILVLNAL